MFAALSALSLVFMTSLLLILVGIVYFMVTLWTVKIGAALVGYPGLDAGTAVLTAGIISAATIIGSNLQKK